MEEESIPSSTQSINGQTLQNIHELIMVDRPNHWRVNRNGTRGRSSAG